MFTGLIRYQGELAARTAAGLSVRCPALAAELKPGDSVAVNGACLTATAVTSDGFSADLLPETLGGTTLGSLPQGSRLNLEPALKTGDPLGGHFVQGHVDGATRLLDRQATGQGSWRLTFALPDWLAGWIIEKGSVAIDGVSLTVQELKSGRFSVAVIPATWCETSLGNIQPGAMVNVEADMLVKAARPAGGAPQPVASLSESQLRSYGYGK